MDRRTDARRGYGFCDALRDVVAAGSLLGLGCAWLVALSPLGAVAAVLRFAGGDAYRSLRAWWVGLAIAVVGGAVLLDAAAFGRARLSAVRTGRSAA